jgi:methylated-DNA-protein-cysteine methyltransferase-like protein
MAACPSGHGIPWHRVVGAGGRLLIAEPHAGLQRRLLETEGVTIRNGKADIHVCGWSPRKKHAARTKRRRVRPR